MSCPRCARSYLPDTAHQDPRLLQAERDLRKLRRAAEKAKRVEAVRKPLENGVQQLEQGVQQYQHFLSSEVVSSVDVARPTFSEEAELGEQDEVEPIAKLLNLIDTIEGYMAQCELSAGNRAVYRNVWTWHYLKACVLQITNTADFK